MARVPGATVPSTARHPTTAREMTIPQLTIMPGRMLYPDHEDGCQYSAKSLRSCRPQWRSSCGTGHSSRIGPRPCHAPRRGSGADGGSVNFSQEGPAAAGALLSSFANNRGRVPPGASAGLESLDSSYDTLLPPSPKVTMCPPGRYARTMSVRGTGSVPGGSGKRRLILTHFGGPSTLLLRPASRARYRGVVRQPGSSGGRRCPRLRR